MFELYCILLYTEDSYKTIALSMRNVSKLTNETVGLYYCIYCIYNINIIDIITVKCIISIVVVEVYVCEFTVVWDAAILRKGLMFWCIYYIAYCTWVLEFDTIFIILWIVILANLNVNNVIDDSMKDDIGTSLAHYFASVALSKYSCQVSSEHALFIIIHLGAQL